MSTCKTSIARAAAIVMLAWIAFWEIYVQAGRPELTIANFVFGTMITVVAGAILVGIWALAFERLVSRTDNLALLVFPIIFPFVVLGMHHLGEILYQKGEEVKTTLKEKPQEEQFHLISYIRNLLN